MHSQDTLRINVIWSNPFRWPSECLFLWLADYNEIYFRTVNTKSCGVGVVKYKRLSSDINRKKVKLPLCTLWRRMGWWMYGASHFYPRHYMEMSDQLHAPATLLLYLTPAGNQPTILRSSNSSLITISNALFRLTSRTRASIFCHMISTSPTLNRYWI